MNFRNCILWCALLLVSLQATYFSLLSSSASATEVVHDFQQCDRDCRWVYGFFDRSIVGERVDKEGYASPLGGHCLCKTSGGEEVIGELIERGVKKDFDGENYWCGNFDTPKVCAMNLTSPNGDYFTTTRDNAAKDPSLHILHCGSCSACSGPDDLMVIYDTKTYITSKMTKCSTPFAMPRFLGGTHDLDTLRTCLVEQNITFGTKSRFDGLTGPTCMDCWTDDIQCDAVHCKWACISKFIDPHNNGKYEGCLKCDENTCGPAFIKCAGANRRSSGIVSDINRVSSEICTVGHFYECSMCNLKCKGDPVCESQCGQLASCHNPKELLRAAR